MVTGDKPDEQVDWSEVAGRPPCSIKGCGDASVGRIAVNVDRAEFYCSAHLFALGATIAAATLGEDTVTAMKLAASLLSEVEVTDLV